MPAKPINPTVRFWRFVRKTAKCWLWMGATHSTMKYGIFGLGSRQAGVARAHRFSYCLDRGIPLSAIDGLVIRHKCDNPSCVRPEHLEPGSHEDNVRDTQARKRFRPIRGSANCWAKLTEQDVLAIRKLHDPSWHSGFGTKALAKRFGVDVRVIRRIVKREKWAHL